MIHIIEDCNPFYIRFTFDGLKEFINELKTIPNELKVDAPAYKHYRFLNPKEVFDKLFLSEKFEFSEPWTAIFDTYPGKASSVHKDGTAVQVSINIPLEIVDDQCVTRWYDEEYLSNMPVYGLPYVRTVADSSFVKKLPILKEVVFKQDEAILFNVGKFHSFDNTNSNNFRKVLLLRFYDVSVSFQQARETLYSFQNC
jgi:hypothetical protein